MSLESKLLLLGQRAGLDLVSISAMGADGCRVVSVDSPAFGGLKHIKVDLHLCESVGAMVSQILDTVLEAEDHYVMSKGGTVGTGKKGSGGADENYE